MQYITHVGSDGKKLGQPPRKGAAERRTMSSRAKVPRVSSNAKTAVFASEKIYKSPTFFSAIAVSIDSRPK